MKIGKILIAVTLSIVAAILISTLVVIGASAYGTALLSDYYGSDYYYGSTGNVPIYRYGDYDYILHDNEATIVDYSGNRSGTLNIPSTINGYTITAISSSVFRWCEFTSITIPDGVESIGREAFYHCDSLTKIELPNSIQTIGNGAFYGCSLLTDIAFPNTLTSIENHSFYNCVSLTTSNLPDSVTSIGDYAFSYCSSLANISLGNNIKSIGYYAFGECNSLERVDVPDISSWCSIQFWDRYSNPVCYGAKLYINGALATEITIPDSITYISDYAFSNCTSLTKVIIGNSVTSIGDYAFSNCGNITNITLPKSLISIDACAFDGCNALLNVYYKGDAGDWCSIEFGNNDWSWQDTANPLYYASALYLNGIKATDISIPSGVTKINNYAFFNCKSITSVYIPSSVTSIGKNAFNGCNNLISVSIGNGVTEIGDGAFSNCNSISKLKLGNKVEKIGDSAFHNCSLIKSIVLPETVSYIGAYAFSDCYNLASINIPYGIKKIDERTFSYCYRLETVVLPETVTEIGEYAFTDCGDSYYQFATVTIPNSVKIIAYNAFGTEAYEYDNITINCPQGSYADEFAQNRGIKVSYYNKVVKIGVIKNPEQTVYAVGSELITTGLKLNITTDDGNTKIITDGFEIGEYDFSTAGVKEIVVSYSGCQTSFKVVVDASLQPYPQSEHPYADNSDISWKYYHPSAVSALVITFSTETAVEGGCDFIYIYDSTGALVGEYTGNELAGKSITVNGNFFKIRLVSDESFSKYGFSIISVTPKANGIKEGDVNGDGVLNASDLTLMRKAIIEGASADMNCDGSTDVRDLVCLKKALTIA